MRREQLIEAIIDARARTLEMIADLSDAQLRVPRLPTVNPPLWELGHVGWFQQHWVLRHPLGRERSVRDDLYDSSRVPHGTRWDLPLPDRRAVVEFLVEVRDEVLDSILKLDEEPSPQETYFLFLSLFHEDMHTEALVMTRQTLALPSPFSAPNTPFHEISRVHGDVHFHGGEITLGARQVDAGFIFDNEKWAHSIDVRPFAIARDSVTQGAFQEFVEDEGYLRRELWTDEGWRWREREQASAPIDWRRDGEGWLRRQFDRWTQLEPNHPVTHVCAHEADAFCRWAQRRLPTEAEWEIAARPPSHSGDPSPTFEQANLDAQHGGCVPVNEFSLGDSALGCRQMLGNVWEWTATPFEPFPGFSADPYQDYSRPWFGTHRVLKGGSWVTRSRMIRTGFRNFYTPDRRDVFAGFRTCSR